MSSKYLLWVDLESTGLSTREDAIIEVAAVLTDADLNELGRYETLVRQDGVGWERLLAKRRSDMGPPDGQWLIVGPRSGRRTECRVIPGWVTVTRCRRAPGPRRRPSPAH